MVHAFVYVIESPSSTDLLDGRTEGNVLTGSLQLADIPHEYSLVTDLASLRESLDNRLRAAARKYNKVPIIHMSMHGNIDGVQLTSNEFVTWADLRNELLPVMRAVKSTLLVCMSSCVGIAGCRMAMNIDNDANFWALVGNTGTATWSDAAMAYASFYHLFFKGFNLNVCVDSMKVASGDHNFVYHLGEQTRLNWQATIREHDEAQLQTAIENMTSN